MNLKDKAVLVTGASRGLGLELSRSFAARGARVVLVSRNAAEVEEAAERIRRDGGQAFGLRADLSDERAIHPLAATAADLAGPLDVLVHNASTLGKTPLPYLMDTPCEDFAAVLETNLVGPFRLTRAVAGNMVVRGGGLVLHVSSDAAVNAYPRWGAYGVSKAALDQLSRSFAAEFEGTGVSFVSLDPGEMDTRMHAAAVPDADPSSLRRPRDVAEAIVRGVVEDRWASGVRAEVPLEAGSTDGVAR